MLEKLLCYRCGTSLEALSLPLSRYDECPSCTVQLQVCRMCQFYDSDVPRKCREEDAEEVADTNAANSLSSEKSSESRDDAQPVPMTARQGNDTASCNSTSLM